MTIDAIKTINAHFDSLVNMFIFLLSGIDFLLLLFFAAVQISSQVNIGVLGQVLQGIKVSTLVNSSAVVAVD